MIHHHRWLFTKLVSYNFFFFCTIHIAKYEKKICSHLIYFSFFYLQIKLFLHVILHTWFIHSYGLIIIFKAITFASDSSHMIHSLPDVILHMTHLFSHIYSCDFIISIFFKWFLHTWFIYSHMWFFTLLFLKWLLLCDS